MSDVHDEIANEPPVPRRNRMVAWSTLGVLGAALAGGGVYAATTGGGSSSPSVATSAALAAASGSATPAPSTKPHGRDGRRPGGPADGGRVFGGPGGLGGPAGGRVLHGEATVATANGGTEIVDTQTGTISAVDPTKKTITVTSSDKVAFTYVLDTNTRLIDFALATPKTATISDLKTGDAVRIVAVRVGDTRTAKSVLDGKPARVAPVPGGPRHVGPRHVGPLPSPSATATGASA